MVIRLSPFELEHTHFDWTPASITAVTTMGGTASTTVGLNAALFQPGTSMVRMESALATDRLLRGGGHWCVCGGGCVLPLPTIMEGDTSNPFRNLSVQ